MGVLVISDHEELINRIRQLLERPENGCAYVRVSSIGAYAHSGEMAPGADEVVFYAAPELTANDFEGLRRLRATCRARLAVIARITDNAVVLRAIRAGAEDFFDIDGELNEEIITFLAKVRVDKSQPTAKGRLITVLSSHVPSDASILSTNLATFIAHETGCCGLLDFHNRGGDLALLLKIAPRHTVQDLISQQHGIDQVMFQQALSRHDSGVRLLASPQTWIDHGTALADNYQKIVDLALSTHSFVLVSSEDTQHVARLIDLPISDQIVFAMRLDLLSLHRAQHQIDLLRRNHVSLERVEVIAMETGRPGELPATAVAKSLAVPRVHLIPKDDVATTVSINLGHPLILESPNSPASIAIKRLGAMLLGDNNNSPAAKRSGHLASARAAALDAVSALVGRL